MKKEQPSEENFSVDGIIKGLRLELKNYKLNEEKRKATINTINEWSAWKDFKIKDKVVFLYRENEKVNFEFTEGVVVKKSKKAPLIGIKIDNSKEVVFFPPSIIAKNIEARKK